MPSLTRSLRAHSSLALLGVLFALTGLAAVGLESVSFGHGHLDGGHVAYHHHLYEGAHEHPGRPDHDHDSEAPAPDERDGTRRTATTTVTPVLFQPLGVRVLTVAPARLESVAPSFVPCPGSWDAARSTTPRAPPFSTVAPDISV